LSYLPLLRRLLGASLLGLPILAVIACYSLWLRIEQYGLTAWRVLGAALLVVILAHALALALAVVRRGPIWLASLQMKHYGHVGRASTELLEAIRRGETRLIEPTYKGVKLGARNFEMQRYE
jgi:hypothetical protein